MPARNPPDEALVEQQSAPWRVFDAPAEHGGANGAPPGPSEDSRGRTALGALANQHLAIAGVLGAIAVGGLAVVIAISGAGAAVVAGPEDAIAVRASGNPVAAAVGEIVVDVTGAVVKPGVYRLATGARVGDAIEAAGGFSPRVDVDRVGVELNLAATLADGAQVRVPSRDDEAQPGGSSGGGDSGGGSGAKLVNLNTASESELDALPGIGPVTAGKIIESRSGSPFKSIDELRARGLVGVKTFEKLKPLISVG
jgi:competence protein ComEA